MVRTLFFLLLAGILHSELAFDQEPLMVKPKPSDDEVEATFTSPTQDPGRCGSQAWRAVAHASKPP